MLLAKFSKVFQQIVFKPIHTVFTQQTEMNGKHIYSTKTKRKTQKQTKTNKNRTRA